MTDALRVFDNSLEKGKVRCRLLPRLALCSRSRAQPYDIRVVTGDADSPASTIAGLNEGLKTMKAGGVRRLYIPGNLSFPKGLASAAGRPRVPPNSPVIFDVALRYIPGIDSD